MAPDVFDRETMLDLSVNVIPLFIILFFVVVFLVVNPFGYSLVPTTIQMALLIVPFIGLAILTYYSGKAIAESEAELEAREREVAGAHAVEAGEEEETEELTDDETRAIEEPTTTNADAETDGETEADAATEGDADTDADGGDEERSESAN